MLFLEAVFLCVSFARVGSWPERAKQRTRKCIAFCALSVFCVRAGVDDEYRPISEFVRVVLLSARSRLLRQHGRTVNNAVALSAMGVEQGSWVSLPAPSSVTVRGRTYHIMQAMDR